MIKVNFELWYRVALLSMNVISKFLWKCILISYIIQQQQQYFFFETQKNCWSLFTQFAVRKRMLCCCCYHLSSSIGHKHNFNFNEFISTFLHRFGDVNYAKQWAMGNGHAFHWSCWVCSKTWENFEEKKKCSKCTAASQSVI